MEIETWRASNEVEVCAVTREERRETALEMVTETGRAQKQKAAINFNFDGENVEGNDFGDGDGD
jgi:hypothetical protein